MVEQFIQGRKYLKAVSPKTLIWYQCSFKAFDGATSTKEVINRRIVELRERGVSPITINSYLRCINAFLRWLHEEHQHALLRIPRLKEEQKVLATLTPDHMKRLLQFSPKGRNQKRGHTLTLLLLDTGLRFAEALGLTWERVDLDNLVLKVLLSAARCSTAGSSNSMAGIWYSPLEAASNLVSGMLGGMYGYWASVWGSLA